MFGVVACLWKNPNLDLELCDKFYMQFFNSCFSSQKQNMTAHFWPSELLIMQNLCLFMCLCIAHDFAYVKLFMFQTPEFPASHPEWTAWRDWVPTKTGG